MNRKLIAALISASVVLSGCQLSAPEKTNPTVAKQTKYEEFIQSGDKLPLSSITDINGNVIDLTNSNKRKLVILFATWCSDSNRALKALNKSPILDDPTLEIIAIAREENNETVKLWRDKNGINVPLAADPDRSIFKQFAAAGIPRLVTVGKENKLIKMNLAEGQNQLDLIEW